MRNVNPKGMCVDDYDDHVKIVITDASPYDPSDPSDTPITNECSDLVMRGDTNLIGIISGIIFLVYPP